MPRKLFCELSPQAYAISREKCIALRRLKNAFSREKFAQKKSDELLPVVIKKHKSLIRRRLGNTDQQLQENKARNLELATPRVSKILIRPGETFSFWRLVGRATARRGYLEGVKISKGQATSGIGGGLCQFTNLLHWMVLHSDLTIVEHHHHGTLDLFPDFNRQIPFGTGTSIVFNYLDYRFKNATNKTYQLVTYTDGEYLCGELRSTEPLDFRVHIHEENAFFEEETGVAYRCNEIFRRVVCKKTGDTLADVLLLKNRARVCYDPSLISEQIRRYPFG